MTSRSAWVALFLTPLAAGGGGDLRLPAIAELPVAATRVVAFDDYREASALAARGGAPLDVALKVTGAFEGRAQQIVQVNDRGEAPSRSRVTVVRDGLLDDSVRGDRWEIALERTAAGPWKITEVKRAWRCRRGGQADSFATLRCP